MAEFKDLTTPQKRLVRNLTANVLGVLDSLTPEKEGGHLPGCGHEKKRGCGCFETGIRIRQAIVDTVATNTPFPKEK